MPQNSSGSSISLVRTSRPSAVTTSTAARLSIVRPSCRWRRPTPPPSVSPATPVWPTTPTGQTRPCAWAATSSSPRSAPPFARAVRRSGVHGDSAHRRQVHDQAAARPVSPARLCPPDRTLISRSWSRPKQIAVATSEAFRGRTMAAGRRSWSAFHSRRASSYDPCAGVMTSPPNDRRSWSAARAGSVGDASTMQPALPVGRLGGRDDRTAPGHRASAVAPAGSAVGRPVSRALCCPWGRERRTGTRLGGHAHPCDPDASSHSRTLGTCSS